MLAASFSSIIPAKERDYLLLTAFVLSRHNQVDRALILIEGLLALGEGRREVRMARAALLFMAKDYAGALGDLELLISGKASEQAGPADASPMSRYMLARCLCETGRRREGEALARGNRGFTAQYG